MDRKNNIFSIDQDLLSLYLNNKDGGAGLGMSGGGDTPNNGQFGNYINPDEDLGREF
jgi:hypothetical protein